MQEAGSPQLGRFNVNHIVTNDMSNFSEKMQLMELPKDHQQKKELMADFGSPAAVNNTYQMCRVLSSSDMVPPQFRGKPMNILAAGTYGAKLGLDLMQSTRGLYVLNGQVGVYGDVLAGLIESRKDLEFKKEQFSAIKWLKENNPDELEFYEKEYGKYDPNKWQICIVKREGRDYYTGVYSLEDAIEAHKGKDSVHKFRKHPKRNLLRTARRHACYDAYPDVLVGLDSQFNDLDEVRTIQGDDFDDTSWASKEVETAKAELKADFDGDETNTKQFEKFKQEQEDVSEADIVEEDDEVDGQISMDEFEDDTPEEVEPEPQPEPKPDTADEISSEGQQDTIEDPDGVTPPEIRKLLNPVLDRLKLIDLDELELATEIKGKEKADFVREYIGKVEEVITGKKDIEIQDAQKLSHVLNKRLDIINEALASLEDDDDEPPF